MMKTIFFTVSVIFALVGATASGEVIDASPNGFTSKNTAKIATPADKVFRVLVENVGEWWDPAHTFSGDATNLSIEAKPGGCFCEKLRDKGGVEHLEIVFVEPAKQLRMRGGLGPLQGMGVTGGLTWALRETGETTEVTLTYAVGGYHPDGLDTLAAPVDNVLGGQLERLKSFTEKTASQSPEKH